MEFDKYKIHGDYHWKIYKDKSDVYANHADKVAKWVGGGITLDVGAGDGLITSLIPKAIGIDDNEIAVSLATGHGVNVKLISIYDIGAIYYSYFDNVLMADTIEHFEYPDKAIKKALLALKPNGTLYITTPPAISNGTLHDKYHYREYTPKQLIDFIEPFGFKLAEPIEIKYHRIYAKFNRI